MLECISYSIIVLPLKIGLSGGIWMSFFDTEEARAVMLAYDADRGGRAALEVTPTSLNLWR